MKKTELKQTINFIRTNSGEIKFSYIPKNIINSTKELNNLYYGDGHCVISISKNYISFGPGEISKFDDAEIDSYVDRIYDLLDENYTDEISCALESLDFREEMVKYFGREEHVEAFDKFKKEVKRLKKLKKETNEN